ncbi:non-ribosomal peptide synthetase/polyketide synthetase [Legionella quinlivanii]|uniref:Non-ribosomal peptide synthetase/polyketide synthetase n=1 Tax=Legionella quinlivanii TaxID=45073 RepID=A0A0W0Y1F4_9GAMM|nr:non-ribosomal peptide synthetase [Legionella quinlivanii]KTD50482.1 non-ribosomal peptide synthetase/polyketide synthetase [Legionella quinlivanii]SEF39305.1 amino acid adenylation domain-containing protein/thioester reductase domain-containing protein [Legionella quinlivanii DSM 21216]STY12082.1 non-ribosomal peptide synthetase/polyketide synthetase [Legionella quinlivanii]
MAASGLQTLELSTAQRNMWLLNALDKENTSYVITLAYELEGPLNLRALEQSIEVVCERHPLLKSYYPSEEGVPVKKQDSALQIKLEQMDQSSFGFSDNEILDYVNQLANRVFDISKPPLIRFCLIKCSEQKHVLIFSMHHIISDGWSLGILLNDLSEAYNAYSSNRTPGFSRNLSTYEEYIQHHDFSRLSETERKKIQSYWQEHLDGYEVVNFPYDNSRLPTQQFKSKKYEVFIDLNTTMALESLCVEHSATLYMGLMTLFCLILKRYTGQNDLILGTPVCNRPAPEFEHTVGLFVNSLVVRLKFQKNPSFIEALAVVREEMLQGLEHQDMPFDKLVELISPERTIGKNPIFQTMFALQNAYNNTLDFNHIHCTELLSDTALSRFDLESVFWRTAQGIKWRIVYNEHLISDRKCKAMAEHFKNILQDIIQTPTKPLNSIAYLTKSEADYIQCISQGASSIPDSISCIHELIERNAGIWSNKLAIKQWENDRLTYQELDTQSSQLARILFKKYSTTDEQIRVAVRMKPGVELAITLLAILKAGMIIIPLNYDDPEERIHAIIKSANTDVVIVDGLRMNIPECITYDSLYALSITSQLQLVLPKVSPETLAYIIFTSGTTGDPKGVMIEHKSLTNTLLACQNAFMFNEADVFACASVFAFDIFFFEFFAALIAGGTTYFINKMELLDPEIISLIIPEITCMHLVPGVAHSVINLLQAHHLFSSPTMRHFATGGDLVNQNLLIELRKQFPNAELSVLYGPTETAILASRYIVNSQNWDGKHPIGKPLDNTIILIADDAGNPQPIGIPGMLYIGGPGVSRGYINAPDLNQEKFVSIHNERYFKTGDIAQWLPNGIIDFIGRSDNQIKIRGHRIELGEVNACLNSYPAVKEAIVLVDMAENHKQLIAYAVLKKEGPTQEILQALKSHLQSKLPHYMVPNTIVILDKLPLTKNGKIDKKALSACRPIVSLDEHSNQALNAVEHIVHQVFCQVLNLKQMSADANFFDMGGNSLLSIQVVIKLRQKNFLIKPQDLFKYQSITALSKAIQQVHPTPIIKSEVDSKQHSTVRYKDQPGIKNILLLGSTGFLGIHLLNQLVNCNVRIYCIIRGTAEQTSLMRLRALYQFYFPEERNALLFNKIIVLDGDISFPDFKLSRDKYTELTNTVDTIINAAANVNHIGPKENLTSVNVDGIRNLINLCTLGCAKTLHHISTVGIKGLYKEQPLVFDESMLHVDQIHTEQYSESKYEAELLIHQYMQQGGQANIYRVGTIGPHYHSGSFQKNIEQHFLSRYIHSTIQLGLAGCWQDEILDITPVDSLATAITLFVFNSQYINKTFHLVSPDTISYYELVRFLQNCGYPIRMIDNQEFKNKLFSLNHSEQGEQALTGIIQLLDSHESPHNQLSCESTTKTLLFLEYHYPELTSRYLSKFMQHGIRRNYFPKPCYWDELISYPALTLNS